MECTTPGLHTVRTPALDTQPRPRAIPPRVALTHLNVYRSCPRFNAHLRFPTIKNLRVLLDATLVSGEKFRMRHFANTRLAVGIYNDEKPFAPVHNQLVVTHSTRLDVVRAVIDNHRQALASGAGPLEGGLILTGHRELEAPVVAELEELEIPCLKVPNGGHRNPTYEVLKSITF